MAWTNPRVWLTPIIFILIPAIDTKDNLPICLGSHLAADSCDSGRGRPSCGNEEFPSTEEGI